MSLLIAVVGTLSLILGLMPNDDVKYLFRIFKDYLRNTYAWEKGKAIAQVLRGNRREAGRYPPPVQARKVPVEK